MNRDKQIEEMAKKLCVALKSPYAYIYCCENCILYPALCNHRKSAEVFVDNNYRKASEVAREIFEEIEKVRMQHTFGKIDGSELNVRLYYLKKKYEVDV